MLQVFIITLLGVFLGLAIGLVVKYFGVKPDSRSEELLGLLPGANCGGCGFAGCQDYVNAMISGKAKPGLCAAMNSETVAKACKILGTEGSAERERKVAVVCCNGDDDHASHLAFYNGVNDCMNAVLVAGGAKGCTFGCLGLGSCARVCPFGAIEILPNHLAKVHPELCKGCGKCAAICPRHVIKMVPASAPAYVLCNSPLKYPLKKRVCSVGCMGCRKCLKTAGEGSITMNGSLAVVNYDNPPSLEVALACPVKCIHASEGREGELERLKAAVESKAEEAK